MERSSRILLNAIPRLLLPQNCMEIASSCGRNLHCSAYACGRVRYTPEEKLCALNKTRYLHRNDITKAKKVFYRGSKRIDLTKGVERTPKPQYIQHEKGLMEVAVDDVFLRNLYKPRAYELNESIEMVKEYARLDMADPASHLLLRARLKEVIMKKRKTKRVKRFLDTTQLPFPTGDKNRICVFTDDDKYEELALQHGAHRTGSITVIREILTGALRCDAYLCTEEYSKIVSNHQSLQEKLGHHLPGKHWGVSNDFEEKLKTLVDDTLYGNFIGAGTDCVVKVGKINQPTAELEANVRHVIRVIASQGKDSDFVTEAALACSAEYVSFEFH